MFFNGLQSLLQVPHLGIERSITFTQLGILLALPFDILAQAPYLLQAAITEPQTVLQINQQQHEQYEQFLHGSRIVVPGSITGQVPEGGNSCIAGAGTQFIFNAHELVVLGNPVGTRQ